MVDKTLDTRQQKTVIPVKWETNEVNPKAAPRVLSEKALTPPYRKTHREIEMEYIKPHSNIRQKN